MMIARRPAAVQGVRSLSGATAIVVQRRLATYPQGPRSEPAVHDVQPDEAVGRVPKSLGQCPRISKPGDFHSLTDAVFVSTTALNCMPR